MGVNAGLFICVVGIQDCEKGVENELYRYAYCYIVSDTLLVLISYLMVCYQRACACCSNDDGID